MSTLHFSQISQGYGKRQVLKNLELTLQAGQCTLLTGENGAGKTTLLRILAGLDKPTHFQAHYHHHHYQWRSYRKAMRAQVFYLHQQPYLFEGSVRFNLDYALSRQLSRQQRRQTIEAALDWAKLTHLANQNAKLLSGGEAQQVALTRAYLRQPQFLLLDEPSANMDSAARLRTQVLMAQLLEEDMAILVSSHDPQAFLNLAGQHLHLAQGTLQESNTQDE